MAFSAVTSFLVSRHVHTIAVQSRSLALQSNSQHLLVDCVTSVGVLVALLVAKFTGWTQADPIFAIGLAGWMAFGAWRLSKQAFDQLVDRSLTDEDIKTIHEVVERHPGILSFHRLRTRLSGNMRNIDFHIVVPEEWSVTQAHDVADALEKRIAERLSPAAVVIHVDPFDATKVAREISENME
jgi:cation diffusion facilitator family transporter